MRFVICILILGASFHLQAQSVDKLNWVIGDWQSAQNGLVFSENWTELNDSTLMGASTITKDGEEQFAEKLRIEYRQNQMVYIAILTDKTAIFLLDKIDSTSVSFLDPQNDFPSRISYKLTSVGIDIILEGSDSASPHVEKLSFLKK